MSTTIAAEVRHEILEPTMDGRALNLDQAARIARLDTPEPDSAIERVRALRARPAPNLLGYFLVAERQVADLEDDCWYLAESNGREGEVERHVAGAAERVAATLYSASGRVKLSYPELADMLRPALATIANPAAASDRERRLADTVWRLISAQVPVETLTSRGLAHALRRAHTATLHGLVAQLAEGGRSS